MKMRLARLITICVFALTTISISAQTAPAWTASDLDGNSYNVYDYLNAGKHVIIDFSATWCGPCWSYHNAGTLEDMWDLYGPDGTDEIMIFYLESDYDTNDNCVTGSPGCNDFTYGDWTAGVHYPIINLTSSNGGNVWNQYGVSGFPTVSVINANDFSYVNLVGFGASTQSTLESYVLGSFEMALDLQGMDTDCGGDGVATADVTAGAGTISYSWNIPGENGPSVDNLYPGTYFVTVTDDNNYSLEESVTIGGTDADPVSVSLESLVTNPCFGDVEGSIEVIAVGGTAGYSYLWSNGQTSPTLSGLATGFYDVVVTDGMGCETTETFEVTSPDELSLIADTNPESCDEGNGSVTLTAIGGAGNFTYYLDNEFNNDGVFTNVSAGTYLATIYDGNSCEIFENVVVDGLPTPEALANSSGSIDCNTNTVQVSGMGSTTGTNITYEWTTADGNIESGQNQIMAVVTSAGTYTFTVFNTQSGCFDVTDVFVDEDLEIALLDITEPTNLSCSIAQTELTATSSSINPSVEYNWSSTDGNIVSGGTSLVATIDSPGTYVLTASNSVNGCSTSESVTVELDDTVPMATTADAELTCTTTSAQICVAIEDGSSATWNIDGNPVAGPCVDVSAAGSYTVTVTGANGCTSTAVSIVTASDDLPVVTLSDSEVITCANTSVTLTGSVEGSLDDLTFQWVDEAGVVVSSELSTTVMDAGSYVLAVTNNVTGCSTSSTMNVEEDTDSPEVTLSDVDELTCSVSTVALSATVNGDPDDYMVSWADENGAVVGTTLTIDVVSPGLYTVIVTESATGCSDSQSATVMQSDDLPQVTVAPAEDLTCLITTVTVSADVVGDIADYTISWKDADGVVVGNTQTIDVTEAGSYSVDVMETTTGCTSTESVLIEEVREDPISDLDIANENGTLSLASLATGNPQVYIWTVDGVEVEVDDISDITFDSNGTYQICLTVTNDCGSDTNCRDYDYAVGLSTQKSVFNISCFGANNGSITLSPSGGNGDYSASWSGPSGYASNELDITDLSEGQYEVILSDTYGYEITEMFEIVEPTEIDLQVLSSEAESSTGASDGSISVNVEGGSGSYTYLWTNGSTDQTLANVSVGEYSVDVTDENGCTKTFGPFEVALSTGVEDVDFANMINLYPNPAADRITLDVQFTRATDAYLNIIDGFGRLVKSYFINGNGSVSKTIDIDNMQPGVYFMEIRSGQQSTTERFIVIR